MGLLAAWGVVLVAIILLARADLRRWRDGRGRRQPWSDK